MASIRNTEQRKKILEHLKSVHTHPTAETVYNAIKKDMPKITLATVYRNLNLLAEQGEIQRLEINKEYRYDACCNAHQHCVCEECGKVMETFQDRRVSLLGFHLTLIKLKPHLYSHLHY